MLKINQDALHRDSSDEIHIIYGKYSGMLLGYIFEVVKDRKLAEQYLADTFFDFAREFNQLHWQGTSIWCQLLKFTRSRLPLVKNDEDHVHLEKNYAHSKHLNHLTDEQKQVFCEAYIYRYPISAIAERLNKTELLTRKILREAFAMMKKSGEN